MFNFTLHKTCPHTKARLGAFQTPHGEIQTPVFMPVGTKATVKTLTPDDLKNLQAQIILANTYHLYLRPGAKLVQKMGGLHQWMGWDGPILTDSGGFQVFSLSFKNKILENGVEFSAELDGGKKHFLTPRKVMQIQADLGADIIMVLDECVPADVGKTYAKEALQRTHKWALECKKSQKNPYKQALFPIVQGATYDDLRIESAKFLSALDLPGIAIGGLSVGETKQKMYHTLEVIEPYLAVKKPRYLMGVGSPEDLINGVMRGIDMFDCVLPTRIARTGSVFLPEGRVSLKNAKFKTSNRPIQKGCKCYACQNFTGSYLHHLVKENEILGLKLATIHNLHFLLQLMREVREALAEDRFEKFSKNFLKRFKPMGK